MVKLNPKVTIIIPVYNGCNYLNLAIDSALSQTYPNIEIIVVNDGSSDHGKTEAIALSYGDAIKYYKKENGGVSSALNFAISNMTGDYFSWLSHDDLYEPNKIEEQVSYLQKSSKKNIVIYSDFLVFSENPYRAKEYKITPPNPDCFRYAITINSFLNGCSLLIPKVAFDKVGLFNTELKHTQDYDMWFRIAKKFRFVHLDKVLVKSRAHENQDSKKYSSDALAEVNFMIENFIQKLTYENITHASNKDIFVSLSFMSFKFARRGLLSNSSSIVKKLRFEDIKSLPGFLEASFYLVATLLLFLVWRCRALFRL